MLVNGSLYRNLCNKTVSDKPNQYLVGRKHLENYEAKRRHQRDQILGSKNLIMKTCTSQKDVEDAMIYTTICDLELKRIDEGLSGITVSTQLTTYRLKVF